jgi:tetratricopeptide (TPR) repeat protein
VECALGKGDLDGVIRMYRDFPAGSPGLEPVHACVGETLMKRGDLAGAVAELRLATDTSLSMSFNGAALCRALEASGDDEGAFECARKTVAQRLEFLLAFYDLGIDFEELLDVDAAIAAAREEIRLHPASPARRAMLGVLLQSKGRCAEALFELRTADDLGTERRNWAHPSENDFTRARRLILEERRSERWVADAQCRAELAEKLERVARGETSVRDRAESVELARIALRLDRIGEAARLFASALDGGNFPRFEGPSPRSEAAAAAVLLGCGRVETVPSLPPAERAAWRGRAVAWMDADLEALSSSVKSANDMERILAVRTIGRWRRDRRLACVREPDAITELTAEEQTTWRTLWARLDEVSRSLRESAGSRTK